MTSFCLPFVAACYYRDPGVRQIAWALKAPDPTALGVASQVMAPFVPRGALQVPISDRHGDSSVNLAMPGAGGTAGRRPGCGCPDAATPRCIQPERRERGLGPVAPDQQAITVVSGAAELVAGWPGPVVFVDNVAVTGSTF